MVLPPSGYSSIPDRSPPTFSPTSRSVSFFRSSSRRFLASRRPNMSRARETRPVQPPTAMASTSTEPATHVRFGDVLEAHGPGLCGSTVMALIWGLPTDNRVVAMQAPWAPLPWVSGLLRNIGPRSVAGSRCPGTLADHARVRMPKLRTCRPGGIDASVMP